MTAWWELAVMQFITEDILNSKWTKYLNDWLDECSDYVLTYNNLNTTWWSAFARNLEFLLVFFQVVDNHSAQQFHIGSTHTGTESFSK